MKFVTENEIVVNNLKDALALQEMLIENDYVVMISKEAGSYVVNYIWSPNYSHRNDVVFISKEDFIEHFSFKNA